MPDEPKPDPKPPELAEPLSTELRDWALVSTGPRAIAVFIEGCKAAEFINANCLEADPGISNSVLAEVARNILAMRFADFVSHVRTRKEARRLLLEALCIAADSRIPRIVKNARRRLAAAETLLLPGDETKQPVH